MNSNAGSNHWQHRFNRELIEIRLKPVTMGQTSIFSLALNATPYWNYHHPPKACK